MPALALGCPLAIEDADCDVDIPVELDNQLHPQHFAGTLLPQGRSRSCRDPSSSSCFTGSLDESSTRYTHLTRTTSRWTNGLSCSGPSRRSTDTSPSGGKTSPRSSSRTGCGQQSLLVVRRADLVAQMSFVPSSVACVEDALPQYGARHTASGGRLFCDERAVLSSAGHSCSL
ncbi:hypothetical protein BD310DRAFT_938611 [Dichomitus squalens]|uniref:Uncharacterized protein n=1 Tax=Dichomitus squalens TaxID=114155 RepID=A0A4Q9PE43_9APHY|nr:hypothetical protein BD310DRAFT_938611 [Dichomitus squalens]